MAKVVKRWIYDPEAYRVKDFLDDIDSGSYYSRIQEFFKNGRCYVKESKQGKDEYYSLECDTTIHGQTDYKENNKNTWTREYEAAETCAEKERFFLIKNGYQYTIDIFTEPKNIGTVEVQFESEEQASSFIPESWFLRDITADSNFTEYNIITNQEKPFYEIVLTGGPCGGKSTALSKLKSGVLKDYRVLSASEVAADLIGGGIIPSDSFECQYSMTVNMLAKREAMRIAAREHYYKTGQQVVIIYDRGIPDNKAYCREETWKDVLKKCKLTQEELYSFYDAIIDISTAADGAEEAYKLNFGNNAARNPEEDVRRAVEIENNIRKAYTGCNGFVTIPNPKEGGWEAKLEMIINAVREALGLNPIISQTQRFLVEKPKNIEQFINDNNCVVQEIEQIYLNSEPDIEHKIKKTMIGNSVSYKELSRILQPDGSLMTKEHVLTRKGYGRQIRFKDKERETIYKTRYLFNRSGAQYVLDVYNDEKYPKLKGKAILTIKGKEVGIDLSEEDKGKEVGIDLSEEDIIPEIFKTGEVIDLKDRPEYLERNIALIGRNLPEGPTGLGGAER